MSEDETPWKRLLRELFGDDADAALEELERMGMDPQALAQASGMLANPAMMDHVLSQIRSLVSQSQGEDVNWTLAHDVARGVAAQGGDPSVTAQVAATHRAAVSSAELWLDAVTDFDPSPLEPRVWSRAEWVEGTMPTWRVLAGPIATSVSQALGRILTSEDATAHLGGEASGIVGSVSPTVTGMHVGQAAGQMAREAFGITDLGFPLLAEPRVVMVPSAVSEFAAGLGVPDEEVRAYLALREAAHVRLFSAAPWLPGHLHNLIERYAAGISIDLEALDEAVRDAGFTEPAKLQEALTTGIFATHHSDEQRETLGSIETLLALIEGWVQEVTLRAAAPHVPSIGALREMMRRRRASGGPAEDTFATLLGLELRPRRLRDAATLWATLGQQAGAERRDAVWSHPDMLPPAAALDDPHAWVTMLLGGAVADDVDRELEALLSSAADGGVSGDDGDGTQASGDDRGHERPGDGDER
ncbi:zinc-dependent metalloprotease [Demequina sp. NBRC 110056]|uniref:zinc-dependent metalloprotease n=1 Tax=Demequina sp. NBRC 110056 TaxID=1570345 RepID=UPI001F417B15|nr:zinc-dependent metalloprotease [Demequina sp. NBRC 110056]